jgi:hypothetical protein
VFQSFLSLSEDIGSGIASQEAALLDEVVVSNQAGRDLQAL